LNNEVLTKRIWDATNCRLAYDPFSKDTFYGGVNRVWKMTDSIVLQADSLAVLYAEDFVDSLPIQELRCIAFDERRQGVMLLGGLDRSGQPFLYRTDDLGGSWRRITGIPLKQPPLDMMFDPAVEDRILVFDQTGAYISTDDGATWEYRDPGLGVRKATCVALDPDNSANIYLGVASPPRTEAIPQSRDEGGGVWRSTDGGITWSKLPIDGLYNYNISHVLALRNPRRVLVGTPCGVYEYLLDSTSTVLPPERRGEPGFDLQVYPNPSRGSMTIGYRVNASSPVRIAVYDVLGRKVASLARDAGSPGRNTVRWDTSGLLEGVYIVTLETREGTTSRRVVIAQ
jgi:hypothetical protein